MEVRTHTGRIVDTLADVIVIGIQSNGELGPHARVINEASQGIVQRLIDRGEITGKTLECTVVLAPQGLNATHLVIIGLGDQLNIRTAFRAAARVTKKVTSKPREQILMAFDAEWDESAREAAVAGAIVASAGQDLYRSEKKRIAPAAIAWVGFSEEDCHRGRVLGDSINLTRRLVNLPPQDMYPESFVEEVRRVAEADGLEIDVWDESKLREQRCEALLAVARGSARPPRLVMCRYRGGDGRGGDGDTPTLALVGKGVTFDSGGLSLKPTEGMKAMKCDMAGAATVLGALQAIAKLQLPIHVVGVMGLVENMVSADCYKLGDVLTARNGRTIEVQNTDAEGRLVLADALNVTVELGAERIIDLATLTGACVVALGNDVVGMMTNDQSWCDLVQSASEHCGEYAWQLPMYPEFGDQIRGEVADIKNVGDGRWGGAITAAKFLEEFVDRVPWIHLDIAGPSYRDKPKPWMDAGGSGVMVHSLVEVARRLAT